MSGMGHTHTLRPVELSRRDRRDTTDRIARDLVDAADADRVRLIGELIEANMGVARSVAAHYRNRGEEIEDLEQVAFVGLAKAAHGFDPSRGHDFLTYAVPTIRGEVRRHFRDVCWMVRPTRRIQETRARVTAGTEDLTHRLGRPPTSAELAEHLSLTADDLGEARAADGCYQPTSLDTPGPDGSATMYDVIGDVDDGCDGIDERVSLAPLVRGLAPRDREALTLRFFEHRTQEQIAVRLGVTQMQVSRILSRITRQLREQLGDAVAA